MAGIMQKLWERFDESLPLFVIFEDTNFSMNKLEFLVEHYWWAV